MTKREKRQKNRETRALMMRFLKGSKRLFCVSMLSAAVAALADMLSPQIIRAAIDNAIGGKEADGLWIDLVFLDLNARMERLRRKIGRASCRERV